MSNSTAITKGSQKCNSENVLILGTLFYSSLTKVISANPAIFAVAVSFLGERKAHLGMVSESSTKVLTLQEVQVWFSSQAPMAL